ncbi:MAG: protein kinase [Pirellulales bacterium]
MSPKSNHRQNQKPVSSDTPANEDTKTEISLTPTHGDGNASPNSAAKIGARTLGRFQLEAELGRGAFGVVYRAIDPQLVRRVALKVPTFNAHENQRQSDRFLREARAAANLHHPNIVAVFDAGCIESQNYIASAFIDGSTLRHVIRSSGRPSFRSAVKLIARLADGLAYAHRNGVVHRDIKPENILIDKKGNPFIADFGLARLEAADNLQTREGSLLGTPAYMSPEQAQGRQADIDGRTDIWALGVMLYELLAGERPFQGNEVQILYAVLHNEPEPISKLNNSVPKDLVTITEKCLRKELDKRYATADQVRDDLEHWLNDEPISARKSTIFDRLARWRRRNPLISTLTLMLILVIAIGTTAVTWQWLRAEQMRDLAESNAQQAQNLQVEAENRSKELDQKNTELQNEKNALQQAKTDIQNQLNLILQKDAQIATTTEQKSAAEMAAANESKLRALETQKNVKLRYFGEIQSANLTLQTRDLDSGSRLLGSTNPAERSIEFKILTQSLQRLKRLSPAEDVVKLPQDERDFFLSSHVPIGLANVDYSQLLQARWVRDISADGSVIMSMIPVPDWYQQHFPTPVDLSPNSLNSKQYEKLPAIFICQIADFQTPAFQAWLSPDGQYLCYMVPRIESAEVPDAKKILYRVHSDLITFSLRKGAKQELDTQPVGSLFWVPSVPISASFLQNAQTTSFGRTLAFSPDSNKLAVCSLVSNDLQIWTQSGSKFANLVEKKFRRNLPSMVTLGR